MAWTLDTAVDRAILEQKIISSRWVKVTVVTIEMDLQLINGTG
jgi:hypothetical protein